MYKTSNIFKVNRSCIYSYFHTDFCSSTVRDWLHDKMAAAQDETYRDAKNLHSKYLRHQAFEREIAANKDRLTRLMQVG